MKLPLRYFLLLSLVLGAFIVPWGWKAVQKKRAAKVARLEVQLDKLYTKRLGLMIDDLFRSSNVRGQPPPSPQMVAIDEEIRQCQKELMRLTDRPNLLPPYEIEAEDFDRDGMVDVSVTPRPR